MTINERLIRIEKMLELEGASEPLKVITADSVCELKDKTGYSIYACKKALFLKNGDFEKACDYLLTVKLV
ncbi:hypothetical protein HCJ39_07225 [Listeria rocourtiae]|uniref:hypothetical protein n=1 Tax=Listeria rocourtiae TaxID=647910 RepID=UPI0016268600|nr:hypothetical protein [Listeria rocourtiae]MBC1604502.1 hypothetical protein [Listeria rocourtiae]